MKKIFLVLMTLTFVLAGVFAQDDDWGDDASWGDEDASASTSSGSSAGGFWDKFKISGDIELGTGYYFNAKSIFDLPIRLAPKFVLGLDYEGDSTKFASKINLSDNTILYNQENILDEFRADVFLGDFVLSAGKIKSVWGKGDKLHVLDNFNSNDYSDFLIPDYLDRRTGEYMLRVQYNAPSVFRCEAIYTPIMHSDIYAGKGCWKPAKVDKIADIATKAGGKKVGNALVEKDKAFATLGAALQAYETALKTSADIATIQAAGAAVLAAQTNYGTAIANYLALLNETSSMSADDLYPNTYKLKYGQFGFYGNFSAGPVDIGVSYYNGHYKQVTLDLGNYLLDETAMPELKYDNLQVFGLDAQAAAGPFTLRAEVGYNLTKDIDGDDPWTRNNSISYLFGFDVGIPLHNLNLNVQATGNFVLKNGEIEDGIYKLYDADYDPTGCYSNNKIVVQLKDTFNYEKGEVLVKAIYGFERKDLILMPELSYKIRDGLKVSATGLFIHNFSDDDEDSEFYGWLDNSFVQLKVRYTF